MCAYVFLFYADHDWRYYEPHGTTSQARHKARNYRTLNQAPKPQEPEIRDLKSVLSVASEWEGQDMHEVVAGVNRLIEGDEELLKMGIKKSTCLPTTSRTQKRFSVDLYMTTPFLQIYYMLSRLVPARRLESWNADGPRMMAVPNEGELHVDGVFEALKGLVVLPLSTTDASGHDKEIGVGIVGGVQSSD